MDLLSDIARASIRAAIKDVGDTFFKTAITYNTPVASLDRFNEDRTDETYVTETLYVLLEAISQQIAYNETDEAGAKPEGMVKLTGLYDDLPATLKNGDSLLMDAERDWLSIDGKIFRIYNVSLDGPISSTQLLYIIIAYEDSTHTK
jgi:hypothetical protein